MHWPHSLLWKRLIYFTILVILVVAFNVFIDIEYTPQLDNIEANAILLSTISKESIEISCSKYLKTENKTVFLNNLLSCRKGNVDIISAFGSYCNDVTLFWFHRILYSQTFLASKIPKFTFISINNIKGEQCIGHNRNKYLYKTFASFISQYFNVKIYLFFHDHLISDSTQRNFLGSKINIFLNSSTNINIKNNILRKYYNKIIVSLFDADDIFHPQRFELFDYIYSSSPQSTESMNGTIIHSFVWSKCINFKSVQQIKDYNRFYENVIMMKNDINMTFLYNFYFKEAEKLLQSEIVNMTFGFNLTNLPIKKMTKKDLIDMGFSFNFNTRKWLRIWWYFDKFGAGKLFNFHNGWPIFNLQLILANPYPANIQKGEDVYFNTKTIEMNYDFYLLNLKLGIYCQGDLATKITHDK